MSRAYAVSPPPPMPDAVRKALNKAITRRALKPASATRLAELSTQYIHKHTPPHVSTILALQARVALQDQLILDLSEAIGKVQQRLNVVSDSLARANRRLDAAERRRK